MKKRLTRIMGIGIFAIGVVGFLSSNSSITGAVSGTQNGFSLGFFISLILAIGGLVIFSTAHLEHRVELHSTIKQYPAMVRLTKEATHSQDIEREMNHLIQQLSFGNLQAGLGAPGHLSGTPVHYLRGRNGARLYFTVDGKYEYTIIGKSSKGRNEDQVMSRLRELYGRKH